LDDKQGHGTANLVFKNNFFSRIVSCCPVLAPREKHGKSCF